MDRRSFIKALAIFAVGSQVSIPEQEWIWDCTRLDFSLSGIPYHQSDASIGTWLGIQRSLIPQFKSTRDEAIRLYFKES